MPTFELRDAAAGLIKRTDGWYANFKSCSEEIQKLDRSACFQSDYYCPLDPKTSQLLEPVRLLFTQSGCYNQCGIGFEFWELLDSLSRFVLWLVPAIILIAHVQYPPLGWRNTVVVVCGMVADPIECMWAMLTRQERYRRDYQRAMRVGFKHKDLAVVAAACDHYGWHDPWPGWLDALRNRLEAEEKKARKGETASVKDTLDNGVNSDACEEVASGEASEIDRAGANGCEAGGPKDAGFSNATDGDQKGNSVNVIHAEAHPESSPLDASPLNHAPITLAGALDEHEQYYFADAAYNIVCHSADTKLGTMYAIGGLIAALVGAFGRQWANREKTWLPQTIPNVTLTYHFIALVFVSGRIGAFTSMLGPLLALQALQERLLERDEKLQRQQSQRLPLDIDLDKVIINGQATSTDRRGSRAPLVPKNESRIGNSRISLPENWDRHGAYLGMNMTWRPRKRIEKDKKGEREENVEKKEKAKKKDKLEDAKKGEDAEKGNSGPFHLFIYAFLFVTISYETAFFLSYVTVARRGFGCRSLTWTLIYFAWLLSVLVDILLSSSSMSEKRLWTWAVRKDAIISFTIVMTIFVHHVGITNTCLCHAGSIIGTWTVNVWPPSDSEWRSSWRLWPGGCVVGLSLMVALLAWVQLFVGRHGASLLCPSKGERHLLEKRFEKLKRELGMK